MPQSPRLRSRSPRRASAQPELVDASRPTPPAPHRRSRRRRRATTTARTTAQKRDPVGSRADPIGPREAVSELNPACGAGAARGPRDPLSTLTGLAVGLALKELAPRNVDVAIRPGESRFPRSPRYAAGTQRSGGKIPEPHELTFAHSENREGPGEPGPSRQRVVEPDFVWRDHPSRRGLSPEGTTFSAVLRPTWTSPGRVIGPAWPCTGRGLPGRRVTATPVRSYRTISPLPVRPKAPSAVCFCGTFPRVSPGGRYPPPRPLVSGLSSRRYLPAIA